jgi:uncharacterized protein involved in exopolysaccharide biosynthesis
MSDKLTERSPLTWQVPLVDLLLSLARHRTVVIGVVLLGVVAGGLQYLRTPRYFRSSAVAVLLPREKPHLDVSVMTGSMETAEDGARRSDTGALMLPPQTDLYLALMHSRSVLERVALEHGRQLTDMRDVQGDDRSDEVIARLKSMFKIEGTEEGMLTVTATAKDPVLAADLANTLIREGRDASKSIEAQLLARQAGYLDEAVQSARIQLTVEEEVLKQFCEEHRLIDPGLQATDKLRQIRDLTASRDAAQVALVQRRLSYTDQDPGVQELLEEIETNDLRIEELRREVAGTIGEDEYGRLYIEYQGLQQKVRFRRDLLSTLSTQADIFRIRAEQPAGNIAVIRPAVPVSEPAGPSKKRYFGIALGAAILIGIGLALFLDQVLMIRDDAAMMEKLRACRRALLRPVRNAA